MLIFCLNSLICLFVIASPVSATAAFRIKDADAVVTMRDGRPCFSYPQEEETQKTSYIFAHLSVSRKGIESRVSWEIDTATAERKGLAEPQSPQSCIEYGASVQGTKVKRPAERLLLDTPYRVLLRVSTPEGEPYRERRYLSDFCISGDEKGEKFLVGTVWDHGTSALRCLKPGESPKRSLWQRIFGK